MVRRWLAVAGVVLVAGCSIRDALSGHQDVVATAAGQELTVDRVAQMIAPARSVPLRRDIVDRVADMWVDYQLLAQAVAHGDSLLDSATVEAASWPSMVQQLVSAYHDSLVRKPTPTQAQVDSAFNANGYRYISHILVAVRADTTPAVKEAKRRVAQGYLDQVRHGADFAALARRVSDDRGSKENGGSLGLFARGSMVKPFEDAAFALQPGEISPTLVETAFGFHILWRPRLDQVRDSFAMHVEDMLSNRADSVFLDSVTNRTNVQVTSRATQIVKAAASNLRSAKTRSRTLATWRGGELTEREFAIWLQAFPPQTLAQISQAPDSTLTEFVKSIAKNEMLIAAAHARHISVPKAQRDSIREHYRSELANALNTIGISRDSLAADTTVRGSDRATVAARHVDAYFTAITNAPGSRPFVQVQPYLADVLRSRASWRVNASGVDRALEKARTLRGPEAPPPAVPGMVPAPIQRAPGGPPVGPAHAPRP